MTIPIHSGSVTGEGDVNARDIITGIQQNFTLIFQQPFEPPPDLAQLRRDYLAYLRQSYQYLDLKGIWQVQQVTQQLSLAAVYVPLKATGQQAGPGELLSRVAGRLLSRPEALELEALAPARPAGPVLIEAALKHEPAVVVLGDPGAGKSTLLKLLALAEPPNGPLPILLPLNAYARRLQQGEINLSRFLGDYYAGRQERLRRVGQLFAAALAGRRRAGLQRHLCRSGPARCRQRRGRSSRRSKGHHRPGRDDAVGRLPDPLPVRRR